ncbi:MAG: 4-hydroxy-3-methylbut-2-enyl diphosphate reductase, partial [Pseudomonas sp.]
QQAVRDLVAECDLVLVIGSQNSSNSQRLAELGSRCGVPARLADGPADLDAGWFHGVSTVLVTAGASVPETFVKTTVQWLLDRFGGFVEETRAVEETMHFQLPVIVR